MFLEGGSVVKERGLLSDNKSMVMGRMVQEEKIDSLI